MAAVRGAIAINPPTTTKGDSSSAQRFRIRRVIQGRGRPAPRRVGADGRRVMPRDAPVFDRGGRTKERWRRQPQAIAHNRRRSHGLPSTAQRPVQPDDRQLDQKQNKATAIDLHGCAVASSDADDHRC